MKKIVFGFFILALFSGCLKSKNQQTCKYDPCYDKAPASEVQAVQDYLASKGITNAQEHCSGVYYVIDNPGTGKRPDACSAVDVTYVGKLTNGTQFDAGTNYRNYLGSLIQGWANTIPLLKEGGTIHLYIPPSMGYGSQAYQTIPANSVLIFDVTLNAVL